jgi:transposase
MFLSDEQWSLLQPLFSASRLKGSAQKPYRCPPGVLRGRPALNDRLILEIIFLKLTHGLPWYDLPTDSPAWQTVYQRYRRWNASGTWKSILRALLTDLRERGGLDLLDAVENHQILIKKDGTGRIKITFPPQYDHTWQLTTARLLIQLLINVQTLKRGNV